MNTKHYNTVIYYEVSTKFFLLPTFPVSVRMFTGWFYAFPVFALIITVVGNIFYIQRQSLDISMYNPLKALFLQGRRFIAHVKKIKPLPKVINTIDFVKIHTHHNFYTGTNLTITYIKQLPCKTIKTIIRNNIYLHSLGS